MWTEVQFFKETPGIINPSNNERWVPLPTYISPKTLYTLKWQSTGNSRPRKIMRAWPFQTCDKVFTVLFTYFNIQLATDFYYLVTFFSIIHIFFSQLWKCQTTKTENCFQFFTSISIYRIVSGYYRLYLFIMLADCLHMFSKLFCVWWKSNIWEFISVRLY